MRKLILLILTAIILSQPKVSAISSVAKDLNQKVLASREIDMEYRYGVPSVSKVFKDNILLNIAYLDGRVTSASQIKWDEIDRPFHSEFTLNPNEAFAYHDAILPEYQDRVVVTTNARFNKQDGFKSDGYLYGDGVCQLASLINWAARDALLEVTQYTNHDFAAIPEVPKQYGVAIYYNPNSKLASARENLYITNNQDKPVTFHFDYRDGQLKVSVSRDS
jgi:VanW like protein